ncbi:hypothetical protein, partial [uncultured Variovorax sp.]
MANDIKIVSLLLTGALAGNIAGFPTPKKTYFGLSPTALVVRLDLLFLNCVIASGLNSASMTGQCGQDIESASHLSPAGPATVHRRRPIGAVLGTLRISAHRGRHFRLIVDDV